MSASRYGLRLITGMAPSGVITRLPGNPSMRAAVVAVVAHRTLRRKDSISELVNMHSNDDGLADRSARRANQQIPVQPSLQKYSAFPVGQIKTTTRAIPSREEGRIMIVTNVGMGCGGRGSVLRATGLQGGLHGL